MSALTTRRDTFRKRFPLAMLICALGLALAGCLEADTLGDKDPDEVSVGDPPAWDNGMGELMTLKCGVCHTVPRPRSAPTETPNEFDLTVQYGYTRNGEGIDGAADLLNDIQEIVAEGQMPPAFATPLTTAEEQAIADWDGS